jgi:predicted ABC-type ATPase
MRGRTPGGQRAYALLEQAFANPAQAEDIAVAIGGLDGNDPAEEQEIADAQRMAVKLIPSAPVTAGLAAELASINGHHVPGTPYTYRHGWVPVAGGGVPWDAEGTTARYHGSMGINRAQMPQLSGNDATGKYRPSGEMTPKFIRYLEDRGISVTPQRVGPRSLLPTQTTGDTGKIRELADKIKSGEIADTKPIIVSSDSRILDGHHNWAARVVAGDEGGRAGLNPRMAVYRVNIPMSELLGHADAFGQREGLPKRAPGEFAARPPSAPAAHDTLGKYTDARGDWTPGRAALHQKIIGGLLAGLGPPEAHPQAVFLGGGPASGKTSVMRDKTPPGAVKLGADDIKYQLPEYQQMKAAGDVRAAPYTHEESSAVLKQATEAVQNHHSSFVLDGLGNSEYSKLEAKVASARQAGYGVHAKYVTVDMEGEHGVYARSRARSKETGFEIPPEVIAKKHQLVTQAYYQAALHGLFDSSELWDNNGPKSQPARLIARTTGRRIEVLDQGAWEKFLAKGGITPEQAMREQAQAMAGLAA